VSFLVHATTARERAGPMAQSVNPRDRVSQPTEVAVPPHPLPPHPPSKMCRSGGTHAADSCLRRRRASASWLWPGGSAPVRLPHTAVAPRRAAARPGGPWLLRARGGWRGVCYVTPSDFTGLWRVSGLRFRIPETRNDGGWSAPRPASTISRPRLDPATSRGPEGVLRSEGESNHPILLCASRPDARGRAGRTPGAPGDARGRCGARGGGVPTTVRTRPRGPVGGGGSAGSPALPLEPSLPDPTGGGDPSDNNSTGAATARHPPPTHPPPPAASSAQPGLCNFDRRAGIGRAQDGGNPGGKAGAGRARAVARRSRAGGPPGGPPSRPAAALPPRPLHPCCCCGV
jgi:hypothetical protein